MSVGKNIPHDSARGHVTGESIYIDDMPFASNELLVGIVGAPVAHGTIRRVACEAALAIPGVVACYTYADIDGHNTIGPIVADEVLLVEKECQYLGQPVVLVAAETRTALVAGMKAVEIEADALPAILSIAEARAQESYLGEPCAIICGDAAQALQEADHTLEGTFTIGGQEHFYLESQAAIVYPGEHGTLTIYSSGQHPTEVQRETAAILGLKQHDVVCITKRMGGAFGGKETRASHFAIMAALVALKTQRPARLTLDVDQDMKITGKRHAFVTDYKVGFTNDGTMTALQVAFYSDGGSSTDLSPAILQRALFHAENAYYIPHCTLTGRICRTHLASNTAFRGFGGPQGALNIENIIEDIAVTLRRDPLEIRARNCYGVDGRNVTPYGVTVEHNKLPQILKALQTSSAYAARRKAVDAFNAQSKTHLKGLAMTPVKFGISFTTKALNQGTALVNCYIDGSIQVSTGGTEMGQGLNTKIQQLVAGEFGIDPAMVRLMPTSTEKSNNASATAASSGTDLNGGAAIQACSKIRARLAESACRYFKAVHGFATTPETMTFDQSAVFSSADTAKRIPFATLLTYAFHERVSLGERGFYKTPGIGYDWKTGEGKPFLYYTTGWAAAEVTIDRFTGDLVIDRLDMLMDIGRSINPGIDRGQLTGGMIQGIGWLTTEALVYNAQGDLLSHSPTTYKIPNVQDVPKIFNVGWIENDANVLNVKQSKAVGEPPLVLGIAVWAAIKQALSYVSDGHVVTLDAPATNEEIVKRLTQY